MQPNCGNSVTQRLHDLQGSVRLLGKAEGNHLQNPGTSLQTKAFGPHFEVGPKLIASTAWCTCIHMQHNSNAATDQCFNQGGGADRSPAASVSRDAGEALAPAPCYV